MSEMMIWTTLTIVSIVGITGVEISQKLKCAKGTAISKRFTHFVQKLGLQLEKLQNTVDVILQSLRNVENDDLTMFAIVSATRITAGAQVSMLKITIVILVGITGVPLP